MTNTLDTQQRNNLITGTHLSAEIPASIADRRAFIVVGAYEKTSRGTTRPSKFLNGDHRNTRFWIRTYEVDTSLLEATRSIEEYQTHDLTYENEISSIEELEKELGKKIDDLSPLIVVWRMTVPLLD